MVKSRKHHDSLGEVSVPEGVLYGPQTARAVANFPISGWAMPREFIHALGAIKLACAIVNQRAKRLDKPMGDAIIQAALEVAVGRHDGQFPVDVFQTGSGTSTNMNANEVIANRAMQILGDKYKGKPVHPNDHVNMCQSSNDVIPSAMNIAVERQMWALTLALQTLHEGLARKAKEFDSVVKIGRTHLMDAVPMRLGQEFSGYAVQIGQSSSFFSLTTVPLSELPIGGTAVGTGLNAPRDFGPKVCKVLEGLSKNSHVIQLAKKVEAYPEGIEYLFVGIRKVATNRFAAQGAKDDAVRLSGGLKSVAIAMGKIASDIRLLGSGPRCGLGELILPATQPGSSIMPGKVNPVICESVIQVCCQVIGCDAAITAGAMGGVGSILELNVAMPMIASNLLTMIKLLTNAARAFEEKCIRGLEANEARCRELVEQSLAMVTALAPRIGYDKAAEIAKEAHATGKTIRQVCLKRRVLPKAQLDKLLDARSQTGK